MNTITLEFKAVKVKIRSFPKFCAIFHDNYLMVNELDKKNYP